ncbi:Leucine rich repeat N-terminal domain containing protein [Novymonas esmeraldas]|uniref:Leucine rich repeat N-terminal domain containing protein n=1 Tax=Novymonas esmeraldas TaxID=1808958 RepID=A0AAW0EYU7_9TRYP
MLPAPWRLIVLVFVAVLLLVGGAQARTALTAERATLNFLREFADEYRSVLRPLWTGSNYCTWDGVTCDANGDVHVNLRGRGLVGEMPEVDDDDGALSRVVSIDLSSNPGIHDDFESDWKRLANLRVMNLSYTSLRGEIPDDWRQMQSLEEVHIHHTAACRDLPQWRGMARLRVVDLSYNNFQGSLRSEWSQLPALQSVSLAGNAFCGCVPPSWRANAALTGSVAGLAVSDAATCSFNGCSNRKSCPKTPNTSVGGGAQPESPFHRATFNVLRKFTDEYRSVLESLWTGYDYCTWDGVTCDANGDVHVNLRGRGLVGEMPEVDGDDGALSRVVSIDLSSNPGIHDDFESDWKRLANLRVMNLSYTSLRGEIPDDWRQMQSLEEVHIHHTAACRDLPQWRGMARLRVVDLSYNNFQGSLRSEWSQLPALQSVSLAGNAFCGCVPPSWRANAALTGSVAGLAVSDAATCSFNSCSNRKSCPKTPNTSAGGSPAAPAPPAPPAPAPPAPPAPAPPAPPAPADGTAATLAFLSGIAADFPRQLGAWTGSDYCLWSGVSCADDGAVTVDLSGRGLAGTLSGLRGADGSAVRVVSLDLSNNAGLSGSFVDSWAALKRLRSLKMSRTSVHGYVPSSWNGMTSLETVDLSDTQACGGLPNWGGDMVSLRTVDLSRTAMRGAFAASWAALPALESADLSGNRFCGCVPSSWTGNAVLQAAASTAGAGVTAASCLWTNRCTGASYMCW